MNKHVGSNFDDLLREDDVLEEVNVVAIKRVVTWQLAEAMKSQGINKTELAQRIQPSRI